MTILNSSGNEIYPSLDMGIIKFRVRDTKFERLKGSSNTILIRKTKNSLQGYFNKFEPTITMKRLYDEGRAFDVRWRELKSKELVDIAYQWRLNSLMSKHWEQPSAHRIPGGTDPCRTRRGLEKSEPIMQGPSGGVWSDWYKYSDVDKLNSKVVPGPIHPRPEGSWSDWYPLESGGQIAKIAPNDRKGIYEISLTRQFGRLRGTTSIVNIGETHNRTIRERLSEKFAIPGPKAPKAWSGSMKWLREEDPNLALKARWFPQEGYLSGEAAKRAEHWRIEKFLRDHMEMPPGQSKLPKGISIN